jgi:hypothetical protein
MELQMEEMQATYGVEKKEDSTSKQSNSSKQADVAALYEDAWEYEQDLENFEAELEIIKATDLKEIAAALTRERPDEERNYPQEVKTVLEIGWTHLVEEKQTHPKEQLELIKESGFNDIVEKLNTAYPDYEGDFEADVKAVLVKRWETLIAIKKEHIKEEIAMIKALGLKHHYAKRIYKEFHGIE